MNSRLCTQDQIGFAPKQVIEACRRPGIAGSLNDHRTGTFAGMDAADPLTQAARRRGSQAAAIGHRPHGRPSHAPGGSEPRGQAASQPEACRRSANRP